MIQKRKTKISKHRLPRSKTVDITSNMVYEKLTRMANAKNLSFRKYVNNILASTISNEQFMQKFFPHLEKLMIKDNDAIIIKDNKKNQIIQVYIDSNNLKCSVCPNKMFCVHIGYAMGTSDIGKLNS